MYENLHPDIREAFQAVMDAIANSSNQDSFPMAINPLDYTNDEVSVTRIDVPGCLPDDPEIPLYVFRPKHLTEPLPVIYHIHGGGLFTGSVGMIAQECVEDALRYQCVVASPEYRLSGDAPYPAAVNDCYEGLAFLYHHANELQLQPDAIVLQGESAGGGLSACTAIMARDKGEIPVRAQFLLYPMLDCRNITVSSTQFTGVGKYIWPREFNLQGWSAYLRSIPEGEAVPAYASASMLEDFSNLPDTFVLVGQAEVFRDEAIAFAGKAAEADVPTELHMFYGIPHGVNTLPKEGIMERLRENIHTAMARQLRKGCF